MEQKLAKMQIFCLVELTIADPKIIIKYNYYSLCYLPVQRTPHIELEYIEY